MRIHFKKIGILGKYRNPEVRSTMVSLINFLESQGADIILEEDCVSPLSKSQLKQVKRDELAKMCDLVIVVGGDGSLLDAARAVVEENVPVVGVNRGRRGFLTDISPQTFKESFGSLLRGEFQEEARFLLEMKLTRDNEVISEGIALNEVVLYSGDIARMIDFEVIVDKRSVYRQRSDGLITATPTGSTAYALSGGGPLLYPTLEAIVLVPMHPQTLSSRPIVIDSKGQIEIHIMPENMLNPRIGCDGQVHFNAKPNDRLFISRKAKELRLLHPTDYDYYHTLRTKLGWSA